MITDNVNEVNQGDTFYAIKGVHVDGADFIPEAIQKGATKIVADHEMDCKVPVEIVKDVRRAYALACSKMWPSDQLKKVAITGTNGKTSTVYFMQQLMNLLGVKAVSLGTIGEDGCFGHIDGHMTTLPPKILAQRLMELQNQGVQVAAMEASSHGLDQGRLLGHHLMGAGFTNLTRDHLDYHKDFESYFGAKKKLFSEILDTNNTAVLNADVPEFQQLQELCQTRQQKVISYGYYGKILKLIKQVPLPKGQHILLEVNHQKYEFDWAIFGEFQVMNLLAAIGLCMSLGKTWEEIFPAISQIKAPTGRLEYMGNLKNGASIFVDYAHTPDGLESVLKSLRPHTKNKLVCVFGCGGDRDTGKRPQMGEIAENLADEIYVTDDNPRSEDPAEIRNQILKACPTKGHEELTRSQAIYHAINRLQENDILLIAGKGHEDTQEIKGIMYPFSDRVEVQLCLMAHEKKPLWKSEELQRALNIPVPSNILVQNITFNTQTLKLGDMFVALTGGSRDGHDFVFQAVQKGASVCLVSHALQNVPLEKQLIVPDTRKALEALARYARMRTQAQVIGITGSSGKTTTKDMLGACLSDQGKTFTTKANLNNDLGVSLMLANMPEDCQFAVIEMGISHVGEMSELSDFVRPDVSIITNIHLAHQEFFKSIQITAQEKAHIFDYQNKDGTAILNKDTNCISDLLEKAHTEKIKHITTVGHQDGADIQLLDAVVHKGQMQVLIKWHGEKLKYNLPFVGEHYVMDSLLVLAAVDAVGASSLKAIDTLKTLMPTEGRGRVTQINIGGKHVTLIDDAYNANPSSMKAGLEALKLHSGRKIIVLGDMLELGERALQEHLDLYSILEQDNYSKVFLVGPLMHEVFSKVPKSQRGKWSETPEGIWDDLMQTLLSGDVLFIKSSHGIGLYRLVEKLKGM